MHVYGAKGSPQILLIVTFFVFSARGGGLYVKFPKAHFFISLFVSFIFIYLFIYFGGGNHNLPMQRCPIRRDEDLDTNSP